MSAKRRPSDAELADMLTQPHFGQSRVEPVPQDPLAPMPLGFQEVADFKPYDRNPRRAPNGEYEAIKAGFRASGVGEITFTLTRRPGDPQRMLASGGNTCLKAIQALWQETGDERFRRVNCLWQPWPGEATVLLQHLKENDLRSPLVFIDRALAIREQKLLLEEELGAPISANRLSALLKERGYTIGRAIIDWFNYAVDVLHPVIPTALSSGMGRPQIERIKALDRAFGQCWQSLGLTGKFFDQDGDNMAQAVFVEVLSRHDADQLGLEMIRRDLETELSVTADIDVQRASLLFGAALDGHPLSEQPQPLVGEEDSDDGEDGKQSGGTEPQDDIEPPRQQRAATPPPPPAPDDKAAGEDAPKASTPKRPSANAENAGHPASSPGAESSSGRFAAPGAEDLPALRERAAELARKIAVLARMGADVIHPIPSGVGYLIGPVPIETVAEAELQLGPDHTTHLRYLWWALAGLSEQFVKGSRAIEHLPEEWRNRPFEEGIALAQEGREQAFTKWHLSAESLFGTDKQPQAEAMWDDLPPAFLNYQAALLWPRMHDWAWESLSELIGAYRAIHKMAKGKVWG